MDKNCVDLNNVIWVIGYRENKEGKKFFETIPYAKEISIKGYEDLIDLTSTWTTAYCGKVTEEDIKRKFEQDHNAKAIKIINSVDAIKLYILNHENQFKKDIERFRDYGIKDYANAYCDIVFITAEEGSRLITEMKIGVEARYAEIKKTIGYKTKDGDINL